MSSAILIMDSKEKTYQAPSNSMDKAYHDGTRNHDHWYVSAKWYRFLQKLDINTMWFRFLAPKMAASWVWDANTQGATKEKK